MEHSSSREVNNSLARQEITRILWNPKVSKHVHNSQPLVPILSHISSVHESTTCFSKYSLILSPILRLGLASALFPSNFPSKALYEHLFPYSCPKPRPSLFFFYFITRWYLVTGPDYIFQMVGVFISMVYWKQLLGKGKLVPMQDVKI